MASPARSNADLDVDARKVVVSPRTVVRGLLDVERRVLTRREGEMNGRGFNPPFAGDAAGSAAARTVCPQNIRDVAHASRERLSCTVTIFPPERKISTGKP